MPNIFVKKLAQSLRTEQYCFYPEKWDTDSTNVNLFLDQRQKINLMKIKLRLMRRSQKRILDIPIVDFKVDGRE